MGVLLLSTCCRCVRVECTAGSETHRGRRGGGDTEKRRDPIQKKLKKEVPDGWAAPACGAIAGQPWCRTRPKTRGLLHPQRQISLISNVRRRLSEIKLIRTDTTLDLSQKAEKVCPFSRHGFLRGWGALPLGACGSPARGVHTRSHTHTHTHTTHTHTHTHTYMHAHAHAHAHTHTHTHTHTPRGVGPF